MKILTILVWAVFSSAVHAQSFEPKRFDKSDWLVVEPSVIDLGLLVIKPSKRVEFDSLTFLSDERIAVRKLSETKRKLQYSIVGYNSKGQPIDIETDSLQIYEDGKRLNHSVVPFTGSSKKAAFTFLLDRSGSMAGQPLVDLIGVLERFLGAVDSDQFLCRIGWFTHQYYFENDSLLKCNDNTFKNITNPGADGGTAVISALQDAINFYNADQDTSFQRNIIIISDGDDGSNSYFLYDKGNTRVYVYIIGSFPNHRLKNVGDFFFSKDVNFKDYLPSYLGNIEKQFAYQQIIEITTEEGILAERAEKILVEKARLAEEARLAEKARLTEESRLAYERFKAEQVRKKALEDEVEAEEAKKATRKFSKKLFEGLFPKDSEITAPPSEGLGIPVPTTPNVVTF